MDDLIRRSDAIESFCNKECSWGISHNFNCDCELKNMIKAIPAVEPCTDAISRYEDLCEYFGGDDDILHDRKEFREWLERMRWHVGECNRLARQLDNLTVCEDAISREWLLDELEQMNVANFYELNEHSNEMYGQMKRMIKVAPSVTVEPKHGEWIISSIG